MRCNYKHFVIPATISVLAVVLAIIGDPASELLRYQRTWWSHSELWRLLTAHFIHLDWFHLASNLSGLWLIWWFVGSVLSHYQWLAVFLILSLSVTLGLMVVSSSVDWYVGLSGVLYGLLIAGLIAGMKQWFSFDALLCLVVMVKIALEQFAVNISLMDISGGPVIVDAHLYGVIAGVLCGLVLYCLNTAERVRPAV